MAASRKSKEGTMKDREWSSSDLAGQMDAIRKSMAVIEFEVDGTIIWANDNFCDTLGYTLSEITGEHHRMFVRDEERSGAEYKSFWRRLGAGEFVAGDFRRVAKDGRDIWIRASYNPVFDENGELARVVKFATNITEQMRQNLDAQGRMNAVEKSMAVIEFNPDGTIIRANDNFCMTVGYSEPEIRGKHHRMFVDPQYAESAEYKSFWEKLNRGEFDAGEYQRFGKGGKVVWIQASYNPIFDVDGVVTKVVKFASDVTKAVEYRRFAAPMVSVVEYTPSNIVLCDKNGKVTYVNPAMKSELRNFEKFLPMPIDKIVGASIDSFHQQPAKQRQIISDPHNLPYDADIEIGDQKMHLRVTALLDENGVYIGPMLHWQNMTEKLRMEAEQKAMSEKIERDAAELQSKVDKLLVNVQAAAGGDLTTDVTVAGEDAIGQLGEGLNRMISSLREIIVQIADSATQFAEGARVVSEGSTSLSDGAQTQSANVEQMSAAVQSLNRMIGAVAENAKNADKIARQTSSRAEHGGAAVEKNIEAMKLIDKSSEQIAEIIGVISEIAAQTNLLALNAAIEAARAGEHGLGFAVVADEVRKLAERSSEAAKEITTLIKESTQRVKEGAELSEQTGEALKKIIEGVEETARGIADIASATEEQASTASEVNTGIQNVASITENNASAAEEMAGSAEELSGQAAQLQELVGAFNVGGSK